MCYVNYVRESTAFMRYACDQGLTANERLLWYALFDVMNARAKGSDWPEGLIPIPNKRLLSLVPFGEDSMAAARNRLKQRGLIDFRPGKKNAAPPTYQINYFYPELSTGSEHYGESCPEISGNVQGNTWGNVQGNTWGNTWGNDGGRTPGIILNYKPDGYNRNPNDTHEDDTADAADDARARARRMTIAQQFREATGRVAAPLEIRTISVAQEKYGVDDEVVNQAIGQAASHGARAPAQYVAELLRAWGARGVRSAYDLVCLQFEGRVPKEE